MKVSIDNNSAVFRGKRMPLIGFSFAGCIACGRCCHCFPVGVSHDEVEAWRRMGRTDLVSEVGDFPTGQPRVFWGKDGWSPDPYTPCSKLVDGKCSIHHIKPRNCADWPWVGEPDGIGVKQAFKAMCPALRFDGKLAWQGLMDRSEEEARVKKLIWTPDERNPEDAVLSTDLLDVKRLLALDGRTHYLRIGGSDRPEGFKTKEAAERVGLEFAAEAIIEFFQWEELIVRLARRKV